MSIPHFITITSLRSHTDLFSFPVRRHAAWAKRQTTTGSDFETKIGVTRRLVHKLLGNFLATFGLSSNFWATYGLEHFFGNLWSFEHFFGNFFQSEKMYPFLVTKISFLCIASLIKRINIHVNSIVRLYWLQVTSDHCHLCSVLCLCDWRNFGLPVACGCVFPVCYMVSGLKSEHVFKMAARVSSSEEMASGLEDSASEDPINIAN